MNAPNNPLAIKQARTTHPIHPLLRDRWSARAFNSEPLTEEELMTLFEAASWAPSSMNEQPWRYHYAHHGTLGFERLWESLLPGNQPWARNAAVLVAVTGKTRFERNNAPNGSWLHDIGMANANLLIQATSMGIHGHLLGGFETEPVMSLLDLDEEAEAVACLLALGRIGPVDRLEEPYRSKELMERERRALDVTAIRIHNDEPVTTPI